MTTPRTWGELLALLVVSTSVLFVVLLGLGLLMGAILLVLP